jgi:GH15 family glucan-1,4-alpha-glucosidase
VTISDVPTESKTVSSAAISQHGIIGDMCSAALISHFGDIDFYCYPEFDSPTVFASLLDDQTAGSFTLGPAEDATPGSQIYVPETNVLLTRFLCPDFLLEVCDWMPSGESVFKHCIVRMATVTRGTAHIRATCRPAFDYARTRHEAKSCDGGVVFAPLSPDLPTMRLLSNIALTIDGGAATTEFELARGKSACFIFGKLQAEPPVDLMSAVKHDLAATCEAWKRWVAQSTYKGRWRETVLRSALALKLLTSEKHGSLLAAATFGLPEVLGGERNWDYRYTWMRDASFTTYALTRLGFLEEGRRFTDWLTRLSLREGDSGPVQIMYRLDGSTDLEESRLSHLKGYRNSTPVLIGNGAANQLQLDIYGELLDAVYLSSKYGDGLSHERWLAVKRGLRWLANHWQDPDEGIWEVRGGKKEFLHSRLMCWVAFDRAVRLAEKRSLVGPFDWMEDCRDAIASDIHENFWNSGLGTFVQYKGSSDVDASTLLMPLVRFISPSDPRWLSTLRMIEQRLAVDTVVMRYSSEDGLKGREGGFVACAFWLVEALARSGQEEKAVLLFEKLLSQANPLGLYAEELSPTGEQLGNFPQALSHLALISAATYLDRRLDGSPAPWS